jgi:Flp pilus assembly protein TadB
MTALGQGAAVTTTAGTLLAGLAGALMVGGMLLAVAGVRPRPVRPARVRRVPGGRGLSARLSRRTAWLLGAGLLVGLVLGVVTGWMIAVAVVPLALVGLPTLLSSPPATRIARLEAMEEWSRSLAGVLTAGVGLEQALVVTLRSAPTAIETEVAALVSRLHARWPTDDALRAFADDLDDATADLIAATLILAARRRGPGLVGVLEGLAESVAADVRARRTVEADRAKPRSTVRWITVITLGALLLLGLNTAYIEPYHSPVGQLVLAALLGLDVACLVWMRLMTRAPRPPRFLARRGAALGPTFGSTR